MAQKIITVLFTNTGVPVTGLTPTIDIYNAATNALVVSSGAATEIAGGWYKYTFATYDPELSYVFTFDGGVSLSNFDRYKFGGNESYEEDVSHSVFEEQMIGHMNSGTSGLMINQIKADTASIIISEATMTTLLNLILQYAKGRTKIDVGAATMTIYAVDNVTPIQVFNLKDFAGMPSVQEVCEKLPTM